MIKKIYISGKLLKFPEFSQSFAFFQLDFQEISSNAVSSKK